MRKYRLLIADDEYFIRQKLKKIIPWEELHLELVAEAENGAAVLMRLQESLDIVILDIKMPLLDGLETAERISRDYPQVKIILLSGFADFGYAQSAIKYGVTEYLLKPASAAALTTALKSCIHKIDQQDRDERQTREQHDYQRLWLYQEVLEGNLDLAKFYLKCPEFSSFDSGFFVGIFLLPLSTALLSDLKRELGQEEITHLLLQESECRFILQIFCRDGSERAKVTALLQQLKARSRLFSFSVLGRNFSLQRELRQAYQETLQQLYRYYFYQEPTLVESSSQTNKIFPQKEIADIRIQMSYLLNAKDKANLRLYLNQLFCLVEESGSAEVLQLVLHEIFLTYHLRLTNPLGREESISTFITQLLDEEYKLDNLKATALNTGLACMEISENLPSDIAISKKIITYIQHNYGNPDLTVAGLAELFQLNISYMGSLFKKVHGTSILQYITTVRIDAAKELLGAQKYKISEIAQQVGYADIFYFSKRFKQVTGLSPKEFIQLSLGDD